MGRAFLCPELGVGFGWALSIKSMPTEGGGASDQRATSGVAVRPRPDASSRAAADVPRPRATCQNIQFRWCGNCSLFCLSTIESTGCTQFELNAKRLACVCTVYEVQSFVDAIEAGFALDGLVSSSEHSPVAAAPAKPLEDLVEIGVGVD